jgi:hypothetical protein
LAGVFLLLATLAAAGALVFSSQADEPIWTTPQAVPTTAETAAEPLADESTLPAETSEELERAGADQAEADEIEEAEAEAEETPRNSMRRRQPSRMNPTPSMSVMTRL